MSFVHLHVHTEYSLLDGFSNIKKIGTARKDMNMPALAITDHGTMFGVIDFYRAAKKEGVKPIIGLEAYLAPQGHGFQRPATGQEINAICCCWQKIKPVIKTCLKIASAAQMDGFYYYPRMDHDFLAAHQRRLDLHLWMYVC